MFKVKKNYVLILVLSAILTLGFSVPVYATAVTGSMGYAVYRDGVLGIVNWHGAIMNQPTSKSSSAVTHITGPFKVVKHGSWEEFLSGKHFMGLYMPKGTIDAYGRGRVVDMGRLLVTENIGYTPAGQIAHNISSTTAYIQPDEISAIRCDGVVEYCYEWFNFRIYGSSSQWDITISGNTYHHALPYITPQSQAEDYMTRIQTVDP